MTVANLINWILLHFSQIGGDVTVILNWIATHLAQVVYWLQHMSLVDVVHQIESVI